MPRGAKWFYESNRNRFNVAVSRARSVLNVFGDREWAAHSGIGHISALLQACQRHESKAVSPRRMDLVGPVWEPRLADAMLKAGLDFEQPIEEFRAVRNQLLIVELQSCEYQRLWQPPILICDLILKPGPIVRLIAFKSTNYPIG